MTMMPKAGLAKRASGSKQLFHEMTHMCAARMSPHDWQRLRLHRDAIGYFRFD